MTNYERLSSYNKEDMLRLIDVYTKNWLAMDGVWFQSIEQKDGMDAAMYHDVEAWKRYTVIEARRLKAFLGLEEQPGLEGLAQALGLRFCANINEDRYEWKDGALIYTITYCRVQETRARKGLPPHPCKAVGLVEYGDFARAIDSRIRCRCLSCYPDITDAGCRCRWEFTLEEEGSDE